MNPELLAMMRAIGHLDTYVGDNSVAIRLYDPTYALTAVDTVTAPTFEEAVRKAHETYTAYLETIPEDMR